MNRTTGCQCYVKFSDINVVLVKDLFLWYPNRLNYTHVYSWSMSKSQVCCQHCIGLGIPLEEHYTARHSANSLKCWYLDNRSKNSFLLWKRNFNTLLPLYWFRYLDDILITWSHGPDRLRNVFDILTMSTRAFSCRGTSFYTGQCPQEHSVAEELLWHLNNLHKSIQSLRNFCDTWSMPAIAFSGWETSFDTWTVSNVAFSCWGISLTPEQ
jgi:hypothetical protein